MVGPCECQVHGGVGRGGPEPVGEEAELHVLSLPGSHFLLASILLPEAPEGLIGSPWVPSWLQGLALATCPLQESSPRVVFYPPSLRGGLRGELRTAWRYLLGQPGHRCSCLSSIFCSGACRLSKAVVPTSSPHVCPCQYSLLLAPPHVVPDPVLELISEAVVFHGQIGHVFCIT